MEKEHVQEKWLTSCSGTFSVSKKKAGRRTGLQAPQKYCSFSDTKKILSYRLALVKKLQLKKNCFTIHHETLVVAVKSSKP